MLKIPQAQTLQVAAKTRKAGAIDESEYQLVASQIRNITDETLLAEWKTLLETTLRRHLELNPHLTSPASETIRPPMPIP